MSRRRCGRARSAGSASRRAPKLLASRNRAEEARDGSKARKIETTGRKADRKGAARAADGDDTVITALKLADAELTPAMQAYFDKCMEKLGFVPNVLKAYAFDMPKLEAFVAMYNDLMLAPSGLTKLEREMIAVAVSSHNRCYYCLTAHGAAVRGLSGRSRARRADGDELPRRPARPAAARHAGFRRQADGRAWAIEESDRKALREAGFPTATSGTLRRSRAFSICRIGSPRRRTCGRIRSIMGRSAVEAHRVDAGGKELKASHQGVNQGIPFC